MCTSREAVFHLPAQRYRKVWERKREGGREGRERAFRHYSRISSLLCIDFGPAYQETAGVRDGQELQAGSPGRSPQCRFRRSRAVASRDVTRRCSDATSRQGQPVRLWSLGNPFSPYYSLLCTPPPTLIPLHIAAALSIAYTCRCSMNSLPLSLILSLARARFSSPPTRVAPSSPLFHSPWRDPNP